MLEQLFTFIAFFLTMTIPHICAYKHNSEVTQDYLRITWEPWAINIGIIVLSVSIASLVKG